MAGLNVALLAFPQGIAFAAIAGLPIEFGIYGTAIASLVMPIFGGSRFIVAGPTNATAVLLFGSLLGLEIADGQRAALVSVIVLLSGLFLVMGAFMKVAALVQYVSRSVITGYITAAALYIVINQIKKVLGFDIVLPSGATFIDVVILTLKGLPHTHWPTLLLGLVTAGVSRFFNWRLPMLPNVAVTLLFMSAVGFYCNEWCLAQGLAPIEMLSAFNPGEWAPILPPITMENLRILPSAALVLAFLSMLEAASIGKSLAAQAGERINLNQEMLGLGMSNIACAFTQGMPASGSLTRSKLNFESGAATGISGVICGLLCILGAVTLGPQVHYIPTSVLGVIVITIGISLFNRHIIRVVWSATRSDRIVFIATFGGVLFSSLDFGIFLGVGVSILLFLRKAAQPELIEYTRDDSGVLRPKDEDTRETVPEVSIVHVEGDLFFGAAELFREQMRRACGKQSLKIVILKLRNAHHLDATSVLALEDLVRQLRASDRHLLVSEARDDALRIFNASGLVDIIGQENVFPDDPSNPTLSTSRAIKRSLQLLGGREAEVKIFVGGSKKSTSESNEE